MDRRTFMKTAAAAAGSIYLSGMSSGLAETKKKPNILIILGDDCTYTDLPVFGGVNVKTPNIDHLAEQGKVFNQSYLAMAMCQPCRTELYTGLYPMRTGTCWNHSATWPKTKSICQYLQPLGYRVGITGKVHVLPESVFPFDAVEGFESNCVAPTADYNCDGILEYMTKDEKQPFCLAIGLVVPHVVWTVGDPSHFDPASLKLPPYLADTLVTRQDYAKYLAEVEVLDKKVGDILATLEKSGKADNTLVIFSSEQGAQFPGCKWTNYDSGVHTGFMVRWPGHVKPGTRTDAMIQYVDVVPTLIEAAGGKVDRRDFDGTSFLKVLLDKKKTHRDYVYAMHNNLPEGTAYPIRAVRDKRYRYIRNLLPDTLHIQKYVMGRPEHNAYWNSWIYRAGDDEWTQTLIERYMKRPAEELYDCLKDPYELNNLAEDPEYRRIKAKLAKELDSWMKEQGDPGAEMDTMEKLNEVRLAAGLKEFKVF